MNDISHSSQTSLALYTDDTVVYSSNTCPQTAATAVTRHVNDIDTFCRNWKIVVNNSKTESVIFHRRHKNHELTSPVRLLDEIASPKGAVKYHGVHLDARLTFQKHTREAKVKTARLIKSLYCLLAPNSTLSRTNKKLLYVTALRSVFTYGCPAWCMAAKTNIAHLQRLQNKCLRLILCRGRYTKITDLHEEADLSLVGNYIQKLSQKFYWATSINKNNSTLKSITDLRVDNLPPAYRHRLPYQKLDIFNSPRT